MDINSIEDFKAALPDGLRKSVNPELVKHIQDTLNDPDMYEIYRENLIGYTSVVSQGKFKLENYINAVKYTSYKMRGLQNQDAYRATFPGKIAKWVAEGVEYKDIASYVSAFHRSKLVILIAKQAAIPTHVLNQDVFQEAINIQADLARNAKSEHVRMNAANSLLTHLKAPETTHIEMDIAVKTDSTIDRLRKVTEALVIEQQQQLASGYINAHQLAESKLSIDQSDVIEGEIVNG